MITLVIIGVVAALTIPNLLQKYQEQATVKKVQKFYSTLANAQNLAEKENGQASDWGLTGLNAESLEKIYEILFKPYFKIAQNCGTTINNGKCVTRNAYKMLNNNTYGSMGTNTNYYRITLPDGSAVLWRTNNTNPENMEIFLDINGVKGPNTWGRDLFYFAHYSKAKIVPVGLPSGKYSFPAYSFDSTCNLQERGYGCTAWVIYKGNMDYLHCNDLSWTGKDKCK